MIAKWAFFASVFAVCTPLIDVNRPCHATLPCRYLQVRVCRSEFTMINCVSRTHTFYVLCSFPLPYSIAPLPPLPPLLPHLENPMIS